MTSLKQLSLAQVIAILRVSTPTPVILKCPLRISEIHISLVC